MVTENILTPKKAKVKELKFAEPKKQAEIVKASRATEKTQKPDSLTHDYVAAPSF